MSNKTLTWDSTIENDGSDKKLLPEGDYHFTVINFERGSFPGSAKMGPCPKASLTLDVEDTIVHDDLYLHQKMEWRLSQFFRSIGLKKHGEACVMNWNAVLYATGMVHIVITQYTDKNGNTHDVNKVAKYLDPVPDAFADNTEEDKEIDFYRDDFQFL